ncbi:MAG: ABC transporter permease [Eubacterium sp.]
MKNPLNKRLPRELKSDFGKYLVIFLFMTLTIGFVSGFLVAGGSMKTAYDNSFEKYNIEDGHFVLETEADSDLIKKLEKDNVKIYSDFYMDMDTDTNLNGKTNSTMRIFKNRKSINKVCLMEGEFPKKENEIAIDRMYADNNKVNVNDYIEVGGKKLKVTGLVALSDYSALFSDNSDMMFDAVKFGVGVMTDDGFETFEHKIHYSYSWIYNNSPENENKEKKLSDDFMETVASYAVINVYVPRYSNMAIQFTGDDIGGDRTMMIVLLYILVVILAFVFAVTINHTIVKEAAAIGTLRASGYTKKELLKHYLAMPMIVSLLAALTGNILGYTVFKYMVVSMYYGSYSLPTYETIWNGEAFLLTTVVPMIIMFVTNVVSLVNKLSLSPLQFIRHDLSRNKRKKAVRLPDFKFLSRFRLRIIFQNKAGYITLFLGIVFANILLLFGMMMAPLLSKYQDDIIDNMLAKYQYILKTPLDVEEKTAEKYCVTNLEIENEFNGEEISVYGIDDNSRYLDRNVSGGFYVSEGFAEKYRFDIGDTITLKECYGNKKYKFKIKGFVDYPAALCVFMSKKTFCDTFDLDKNFYNGYFTDKKLDIDENYIQTCITKDDLTKTSRQLTVSMGKMFYMINVFAIVLFALLIYLLTKLIIEKNTTSISMVKILGYNNGEISRLYLLATTWVVIISIALSFVIATEVIDWIYVLMMKEYSGWLTFYIKPTIYGEMFAMGMAAYIVVALLQFRKIKKIPMDQALKNIE